MPREISEITKKDILFMDTLRYVKDKIPPEDLKEFIAYLKTYIPKSRRGHAKKL